MDSDSHNDPCLQSRRKFLGTASMAATVIGAGTASGEIPEASSSADAAGPAFRNLLWYDRPATDWMTEALPVGNGRMGAMIFGGTGIERIQFNEISLWSGSRTIKPGPPAKPEDNDELLGSYQAFGDVMVHLGHDIAKVEGYRRELDLDRAVHSVKYRIDGVTHRRTCFASHPAGVVVVRLETDRPGTLSGQVVLTDMHGAKVRVEDNRLRTGGKLENGFEYMALLHVSHQGGAVRAEAEARSGNPWEIKADQGFLSFDGCDQLTLILGAGTNFVQDHRRGWLGDPPAAAVMARVGAATELGYDKLLEAHLADHQGMFGRFRIDLGESPPGHRRMTTTARLEAYRKDGAADPELEALFCQFGRYLLMGCSRPGSLPANLQGVWNDSNTPPWACDYHSNINVEMNYWPAETANLPECHRPFIDYVDSIREVSKENTRLHFGAVRGWTVQTMNNACGVSHWKWNTPGSAWYARHLWEAFAFGRDKEYLRQKAYPVLKEVCEFWEDRLKDRADGTLVAPDGWSPEHGPVEDGVSYDQQIIWDLFTNTLEAADVLGDDRAFRDRIAGLRQRLLQPKIGRWGQLQEWEEDKDDPKNTHRHVSHLFGLYPGRQISRALTPDLAEAARVSLEARGDASTGWSRAWKINFWARLWDGNRAHRLLRQLIHLTREKNVIYGERGGGVYPNLLCSHPPYQIDGNLGAVAGYCEMLVQSHAGRIHLLPALPDAWPTGSVTGLRARGGFEIDVVWREGKLTRFTVRAKAGKACKVVYLDREWDLALEIGTSRSIQI